MIALVLVAALISPVDETANLIGLWDSVKTSSGGIGQTLEFRGDGTFVEAATVLVDGYYRVIGDRLVVGQQPLGADAKQSTRIKIEGDVFVQTGPDGTVIRRERIGPGGEGKAGIVGAWRYHHYTNAVAFERYTDEGRFFFRLPMSSSVGRYVLKGGELLLLRPNQPDVKMRAETRGDTLSLSGGGRVTDYRRDPAGPWYDREHIARQPQK